MFKCLRWAAGNALQQFLSAIKNTVLSSELCLFLFSSDDHFCTVPLCVHIYQLNEFCCLPTNSSQLSTRNIFRTRGRPVQWTDSLPCDILERVQKV